MIRPLLGLLLAVLIAVGATGLTRAEDEEPAPSPAADEEFVAYGIAPIRLVIPRLGVAADVVPVGLDDDGAMSAPKDPDEVAWYALGPGMGLMGNVVLAAHVDWAGRQRVFGSLGRLGPGDEVIVWDEIGQQYVYQVEWSRWVDAGGAPVEDIFAQETRPELTLITCGGAFDQSTRQYVDRLIVRAKGISADPAPAN